MSFSSFSFLFLFLPPTLIGYYVLPNRRSQLFLLLIASIIFYCQWSPAYSLLMLFTVVFDFYLAAAISGTPDARKKHRLLILSIATNLIILGFFKYYGFFVETVNQVGGVIGTGPLLPWFRIVLPIGISFYTFQSMSYVIDVYRGKATAHRNLLPFASYVTMFPHQISGPLVRHDTIVPQLENEQNHSIDLANLWRGVFFFIVGLAKKILIADRLAVGVSPIVANIDFASQFEAVLAMFGYTMQLYFDFSGYSDMAVGLGLMMNIQFPQNFNSPYRSRSITEFWRRWHMTLSSWLRDYVYISLGGNRLGPARTYFNLMVTMLLGGLWHGASWNFVLWGFLHGCGLSVERWFSNRTAVFARIPVALRWAMTFALVNIGWVFFRAPDLRSAMVWLDRIVHEHTGRTWQIVMITAGNKDRFFLAMVLAFGLAWFGKNSFALKMKPTILNAVWLGILFGLCLMYLHEESPFLYFQF